LATAAPSKHPGQSDSNAPQSLDLAIAHHQQGRLLEAERIYRAILTAQSNHPVALHLLGLARYQRGDISNGLMLVTRAIAEGQIGLVQVGPAERASMRAKIAAAYNDLGCIYRDFACIEEAQGCFNHALALAPHNLQPLENLGDCQLACRNYPAAIESFAKLVEKAPTMAQARVKLGTAYLADGQLDLAELCCYRALDLAPNHAGCYNNLGTIYRFRQKPEQAEQNYLKALSADSRNIDALHNLGVLYNQEGKKLQAQKYLRSAIDVQPLFAEAHNSLGQVYAESGDFARAGASYRRALCLTPGFGEALNNLGIVQQSVGELARAEATYRRALAVAPTKPEIHNNLALAQLRAGNLKDGFRRYEWRWKIDAWPSKMPPFPQPLWQGEDLRERTLLIHCEQGFGDNLQFVRFLPLIRPRCGRLLLHCAPRLKRLFLCLEPMVKVFAEDEALPDFDRHLPLMSLPRILETDLATLPTTVPYLAPPAGLVEHWRPRLAPDDGRPRLGLVWSTELRNKNDHDRLRKCIDLALIEKLARSFPGHFYALQQPLNGECLAPDSRLRPILPPDGDFADTAAIMTSLDLVISIDSAVAHLGGALNRPTWVLLRSDSCWRWFLQEESCRWYPSARLFRQPAPNDWNAVIDRVAEALEHTFSPRNG
jgi:tetratricopeptide (TPR) repeat protein